MIDVGVGRYSVESNLATKKCIADALLTSKLYVLLIVLCAANTFNCVVCWYNDVYCNNAFVHYLQRQLRDDVKVTPITESIYGWQENATRKPSQNLCGK